MSKKFKPHNVESLRVGHSLQRVSMAHKKMKLISIFKQMTIIYARNVKVLLLARLQT